MKETYLLRTKEAAAILSRSVSSLEQDRLNGRLGIRFVKVGKRSVRYRSTDLEKYLQSLPTFTSTSAADKGK